MSKKINKKSKQTEEEAVNEKEIITHLKELTKAHERGNKIQERVANAIESLLEIQQAIIMEVKRRIEEEEYFVEDDDDYEYDYDDYDDDDDDDDDYDDDDYDYDEDEIEKDISKADDIIKKNKKLSASKIAQLLNQKKILNDQGKNWHYKQVEKRLNQLIKK